MADKESCTICLETLFRARNSHIITRLQPCGHYYHTECINLWTERSNNCPTCRCVFDVIETIDAKENVVSSVMAEKKDHEHIEEYFVGRSDDEMMIDPGTGITERRINSLIARSNRCILCERRAGYVTSCDTCSSTFHPLCLGLYPGSYWMCPMCDSEQLSYEGPQFRRRCRHSATTQRIYAMNRETMTIARPQPVIEEQIIEKSNDLTQEERNAWETLDFLKNNKFVPSQSTETNNDNSSKDVSAAEASRYAAVPSTSAALKKKQKLPSRRGMLRKIGANRKQKNEPQSDPAPKSSGPSLVTTLLEQMKESKHLKIETSSFLACHANKVQKLPLQNSSPPESFSSPSSTSSPVMQPIAVSPDSSISDSEMTVPRSNKSLCKMVLPEKSLTLEQKSTLQEIVRNKLRPLYKEGKINENQYTDVNKKVSHVLYDICLNEGNEDYDFENIAKIQVTREIERLLNE